MGSENPTGADNQQGSRVPPPLGSTLTPQRLHAELLATDAKGLEAYLQGAYHDGTASRRRRTFRFGQSDRRWLDVLTLCLERLGHRSWIYREGRERRFWVLETSAGFLSRAFEDEVRCTGPTAAVDYVRGYFDAEGGMPRRQSARLYFQFSQKSRRSLEIVASILQGVGIESGVIHNPSRRVDPDYWRFFVSAGSHQRFMSVVGSWHPRKRQQMKTRMKI